MGLMLMLKLKQALELDERLKEVLRIYNIYIIYLKSNRSYYISI